MKRFYVALLCTVLTSNVCAQISRKNIEKKRAFLGACTKVGFGAFLVNAQWHSWYYTVVKPYRRLIREFDDAPREESGPPSIPAKIFSTIGLTEAAMLMASGVHDVWKLVQNQIDDEEAEEYEAVSYKQKTIT